MAITRPRSIAPGEITPGDAQRSYERVKCYLENAARTDDDLVEIGPETCSEPGLDDKLILPRPILDLLLGIFDAIAAGRGVQIIPINAELTTQQAADVLNVSRPYLIKLLVAGDIQYRLVGRHRRVRFDDLMNYKARDDAKRRAAADAISQLGQELEGD